MQDRERKHQWLCWFDLLNRQEDYAKCLKTILWLERCVQISTEKSGNYEGELLPFYITRADDIDISQSDSLLRLERRFIYGKNMYAYITSDHMLIDGLRKEGLEHNFNYYFRINIENEIDIVELQNLILLVQALPTIQNRIAIRFMKNSDQMWETKDFFHISNYLRFIQERYHFLYACYDENLATLRPLTNTSSGVQSTFLPLMEVDNQLCQLFNKPWMFVDHYTNQPFDKLYTALELHGDRIDTITQSLFQIGLHILFDNLSGKMYHTSAKKHALISYLIDMVRASQGITALDMLLFGALAGSKIKKNTSLDALKEYLGHIQLLSLAVCQILENVINHSERNIGVFTFRLQRNKAYLSSRYPDYAKQTDEPILEIMIADSNCRDGIVDNFLKSSKADIAIKDHAADICLADMFGLYQSDQMKDIWCLAQQSRPEMCHGLRTFFYHVNHFGGAVRVRSASQFVSNSNRCHFYYDGKKNNPNAFPTTSNYSMPGTHFSIVINRPIKEGSYDNENKWDFNFDTIVYATTYRELAQALLFDNHVLTLSLQDVISLIPAITNQESKDKAVSIWKSWFNQQFDNADGLSHVVYSCDLDALCNALAKNPTLGEPFCKGFLSSRFFNQLLPVDKKKYICVIMQNPSARFSQFFSQTVKAISSHGFQDIDYISVYFYPKQFNENGLPYCATTLHQLLEQPMNDKVFPKIFPYTLFLKTQAGHSLFEEELYCCADKSILKNEQGYKISDTHMRLGNKVHLDTFYEMALFFENPNYAYYTAFLLLRKLFTYHSQELFSNKKLILYGYASYSRAIIWALHQILEEYWKIVAKQTERSSPPEVEFLIFQNNLRRESEQPQTQMYYSVEQWQRTPSKIWEPQDSTLVLVVPISSSMTTFNKMLAELNRETGKQFHASINFTAFWVRDRFENESVPTDLEKPFWSSCDPVEKTITSNLTTGKIHYLRSASSQWSDPLKCKQCFPEDILMEYPLVETDPTSTIPTQQFYLEPEKDSRRAAKNHRENDIRIARLKGNTVYGHVSKGSSHYQFFINSRTYFQQEHTNIKNWLIELRSVAEQSGLTYASSSCINVLVVPQQIDNVEFGQYVYEHYFRAQAECIVINTEKEYRSNLQAEYSGLFQRLAKAINRSAHDVKFFYVDNSVNSGNSFTRAMSLVSSSIQELIDHSNTKPYKFEFEKVFLLISRLSEASKKLYVADPDQNYHAYVEINISTMRTFGDSCIPCKIQAEAQKFYKTSATKAISSYWERKIYDRRCIPFDQLEMESLSPKEQKKQAEIQSEGFRRLVCSHRASQYIRPIQGMEKSKYLEAVKAFLEELRTTHGPSSTGGSAIYSDLNDGNRLDWISAGLKIMARPFFTFDFKLRCVIMDLFLMMVELLTQETSVDSFINRCSETDCMNSKQYILKKSSIEWCKSFADDLLVMLGPNKYTQMVFVRNHILKGLTDMKSNYILRKETLLHICRCLAKAMDAGDATPEDIEEFFQHYLRSILRIIHSSSDETKGVWLEHLLQFGEEYPNHGHDDKDGIAKLASQVSQNVRGPFLNFLEMLLVENNRPIYQAVVEYSKIVDNPPKHHSDSDVDTVKLLLNEYHMRNAQFFLSFGDNVGTADQLNVLKNLLQPEEENEESYLRRYYRLGETLKAIVGSETNSDAGIILFGEYEKKQSSVSAYLNLPEYFTIYPPEFQTSEIQHKSTNQLIFEQQWVQAKKQQNVQSDLGKKGFCLISVDGIPDKFNIVIKLNNNYDDLQDHLKTKYHGQVPMQNHSLDLQKIIPIFIFIPCMLPRQKALGLVRKILMFRCKLVDWLEKDFNNNAIAGLSQQQSLARLLSTDKMGDHAENDFVECHQQLLLATDEVDFAHERDKGNWGYAVNEKGKREELYEINEVTSAPLHGVLEKTQKWFFLRSYINSRIARLFRTMARTENELDLGGMIDADNYYALRDQSILMRPVFDLGTVFSTPLKPGYTRKNYLRQLLELVSFEVNGENDYAEDPNADISVRIDRLLERLETFRCVCLNANGTEKQYTYLSEYLAVILLDCFISGVKAGATWNQETWGGDAFLELHECHASEKCKIKIFRERGFDCSDYSFDYLVIQNEIYHTLRTEKKGPGMSQAAMKWYIEGLWRSCIPNNITPPKVLAGKTDNTYTIKLPILTRNEEEYET